MIKLTINSTTIILAKAFKAEEGATLAAEIANAIDLAGRRVVIIDHPPTAGLAPFIEALAQMGAEAHLRDHHSDSDRDGATVARCRAVLGERSIITTRAENPACSTLLTQGEFAGDMIVADADQDGLTAALKAAGIWYPEGDADAAVLDGPMSGKVAGALSPIGFALVRAWGAIPAFGDRNRDAVVTSVATAFAAAVSGDAAGAEALAALAVEYERKVASAKALAATAELIAPAVRFVDARGAADFDPPTLAAELDKGVAVSGRKVSTGPIAGKPGGFGTQVSLARTKQGETVEVDLAKLVPTDWARGPEHGVISNTPFLLHLSPERWEAFRPILLTALAD